MSRRYELATRLREIANELTDYGAPTEEVLISCREAARLLNRNPSTISLMIQDGRLDKVTIGESTGIRLSQIRGMM
jgi:hypothetical protein